MPSVLASRRRGCRTTGAGILSATEDKRALRGAIEPPACLPITVDVLSQEITAQPILGNILGSLGF